MKARKKKMDTIISNITIICKECKIEKPIDDFYKTQNNKNGHCTLCKDCYGLKFRFNPHAKYLSYKNSAKRNGRSFSLSEAEFFQFWGSYCYYCGDEIDTVGLDRIDSSKGYELNNIVSCCYRCNTIKLDYSKDEFLSHVDKIYKYQHTNVWRD